MKKVRKFKKHASSVHIKPDGSMHVFYQKLDKDSNTRISWHEILEEKIAFHNCQSKYSYTFKYLCFEYGELKFLEYIRHFEVYPVNNIYALEQRGGENFDASLAKPSLHAYLPDGVNIQIPFNNVSVGRV